MRLGTRHYIFDGILDDISNNCDLFGLPKSKRASNSLELNGRVPLRFEEVYAFCHR